MIDINNYHAPKDLLTEKIIAVSGAGDGIGRNIAKLYAQYGATVLLLGKTVSKLEKTYDEIEQAGHSQAAIIPIDFEIAEESTYQEIADAIEENFGRLDGLLHNAAQLGERTSIANYSFKNWQKLMQVNITAPFLLTKKCLPLLQKSEDASIIFTGSSVGIKGRAYWGAYAVSKAANENLMEILADELEKTSKIRVNSFNPGATRTQMRANAYPAEDPSSVKSVESLHSHYLYLMGKASMGVTGQCISYQASK